ncbi:MULTISPECIES: biotin transporter BioY [unclassified Streptococcus]|uniref:biotin transporter BioY n=1 Tax=unclassified Streptococcus TaxID=2608887 RepID=UPI0010726672|nr:MULTISPECIES: biotin transporter BioY [unclassified Streptococcus]MBF0787625.1 biotin transporter BioY [Streptococcus sp. 19428wC2_LYSM12]MCQ9212198.1 biotin transporter BioY [Streptococcus sp. B01]MCQ9213528.1 biotin transporter BioY [Streptococcus sp. O1]TFV05349.1 biotin transporter BioY [Streptococcus sp. LYSM12]
MSSSYTKSLVYPAIGAGVIVVLSQIIIPLGPVPFTLQTLAVGLIASLYPPKEAITSIVLYLLLGAIGLPVFAGFSGGIASLWGPTAGFLWGFLLYAGMTGRLTSPQSTLTQVFLANLLGDTLCFGLGSLVFSLITQSSFKKTFALTVLPFLIPDLVKLLMITIAYQPLSRIFKG